MNIWRIHLKSAAKEGNNPQEYCITNNIAGIGWPVNSDAGNLTVENYEKLCRKEYKKLPSSVNAMLYRIEIGDYMWARKSGKYYLGKVTSKWKYGSSEEFKSYDLINYVEVQKWEEIGTLEKVPGKVVSSFRAPSAVQQIHDETVSRICPKLFDNSKEFKINESDNIFSLIGDQALEDLVALYLQKERGYFVYISTCKSDTKDVECVLVQKEVPYHKAYLQVKSGNAQIDIKALLDMENVGKFYLFANQKWPQLHDNFEIISAETIEQFMLNNRNILPKNIEFWIKMLEEKEISLG